MKRKIWKWYFHENSDNFFPEIEGYDFKMENEFVHEIGDYVNGGVDELRELLQKINHYLKDDENLEKLITDDIEQY